MSYIKDSHGSVIRTADASGNAMQEAEDRADYDAFGNVYTGSRNTPFGYSGEYVDSESGNIYLRNRYYSSATGRFITEDPAQDGLNWYVYAGNNPVSFVDPWGWITEEEKMMYQRGELSQQAYDILNSLTARWEMMISQEDKDEVHRLAEQFRSNGYYAEDCTVAANACLWNNGQYYIEKISEFGLDGLDYGIFSDLAIDWEKKVLAGGQWDYKVNKANWMPENGIFIMYGELISVADFGNVNYGYTGTIIGFGEVSLYTGRGWAAGDSQDGAPYYGDSQVDHYFIEKGISQASGMGFDGQMCNIDVRPFLDIMKGGKDKLQDVIKFFGNVGFVKLK